MIVASYPEFFSFFAWTSPCANSRILRHLLSQSDSKLKPNASSLLVFSALSGFFLVSVLSSQWPHVLLSCCLIGQTYHRVPCSSVVRTSGRKIGQYRLGSGLTHPQSPPKSARLRLLSPILLALVASALKTGFSLGPQ